MAEFPCTRCGKCCISLGRHMVLVKSVSQFSHTLQVRVSGETLPVQVSPRDRDLFLSRTPPAYEPGWCPFLRREETGAFVCTIHSSRPRICRTFQCCTMRIFDQEGSEVGMVKGRRSLSTEDPRVRRIWDDEIVPFSTLSEDRFLNHCRSVLAVNGYGCEIYDS
ncbi:MAG: YkgJ family cysteine cluster protein [Methanolinea sp.]|jgi:Fe-S-cluster containining protein|nr:YkgJ family cysteine cluster protein [Methanolinea sp.]